MRSRSARTPAFEDLLALAEDRCTALRDSVASSSDPHVRVPSCPDWSLRDLVEHLTEVHRFWTAAVVAGPSERPPTITPLDDPRSVDLLARSAAAMQDLLTALRAAGPTMGCWTWWGDSEVPMTSGAVARHQVHEAAIHACAAQRATGAPQPVPTAIAGDGIAEFIDVSYDTAGPWPYAPARISLHATEGASWLLELQAPGAPVPETVAELSGSASDLLLTLHGRLGLERLRSQGDRVTLKRFLSWPDLE